MFFECGPRANWFPICWLVGFQVMISAVISSGKREELTATFQYHLLSKAIYTATGSHWGDNKKFLLTVLNCKGYKDNKRAGALPWE